MPQNAQPSRLPATALPFSANPAAIPLIPSYAAKIVAYQRSVY
ncbi:hypothetical protein [Cardiobacterium valvarum]|nr:hypothetical protein [Cardiobacterium valvarum]